jgi:hypothetical protein
MQTSLSRRHLARPSRRAFRPSPRGRSGGCIARALPGLWLTISLVATAQAQPMPPGARPDPLDPKASVPAVRYSSSLAQYGSGGAAKPLSWKEANDAVARIGGWRVYAREAQQSDPASAAKPATAAPMPNPATTPAEPAQPQPAGPTGPSSHGGHSGHKQP